MKPIHTFLALLMASALLFSCKDKDGTTTTEERIEENHPKGVDNTAIETNDSTTVVRDSVTDHNMKDQSDTHGRDVQSGK